MGGGGGSGSVGATRPIASPGLYGRKVLALLWMLATLLGIDSTCPSTSVSVPRNPFASAIRYHIAASPHTLCAIELSVSPPRTV